MTFYISHPYKHLQLYINTSYTHSLTFTLSLSHTHTHTSTDNHTRSHTHIHTSTDNHTITQSHDNIYRPGASVGDREEERSTWNSFMASDKLSPLSSTNGCKMGPHSSMLCCASKPHFCNVHLKNVFIFIFYFSSFIILIYCIYLLTVLYFITSLFNERPHYPLCFGGTTRECVRERSQGIIVELQKMAENKEMYSVKPVSTATVVRMWECVCMGECMCECNVCKCVYM